MRSSHVSTWAFVVSAIVAVLGVVAAPPVEAGQKVPQPAPLIVVDSLGKTVGLLGGLDDDSRIREYAFVKVGGDYVRATVDRAGFYQTQQSTTNGGLFFTEFNCLGTALVQVWDSLAPMLIVHGTTGYYALPDDASNVAVKSLGFSDECELNIDPPDTIWGAVPRTLDLSVFTPQFSVK